MVIKSNQKADLSQGRPHHAQTSKDSAVRQAMADSHRHLQPYLLRRLGSVEEAEEVMQTFILRAIDRADQMRDIASVRGWLSRVLASAIANHQRGATRRRQREISMSPDLFDNVSSSPDSELDALVCACLHDLLPTLKSEYAEVIDRVDLQGEPREQVAADLGISVANLGVRLDRARQLLKERLIEMCLTCPEHGFMDCGCDTARRRTSAQSRGR